MVSLEQVNNYIKTSRGKEYLHRLCNCVAGSPLNQVERYSRLVRQFETGFSNTQNVVVCSAPGRTEIAGNHTDHENGKVLAAAINLDTIGIAGRNNKNVIRILSEGYRPFEIQLDDLDARPEERNTSPAMVRGICQYLHQNGDGIGGFDAVLSNAVPAGSGLSSSASFEILIVQILNILFNQERLSALALARAGHFAEVEFFNKPCGLMDQISSAVGGLLAMDFSHPDAPIVRQVKFDLESSDHVLVITETGGSHASLTDEYAAVKGENRAVSKFFGAQVLREVDEKEFYERLPSLRKTVGDRAVLRAIHFFNENRRVLEEIKALESGNFSDFLKLMNESGNSSWTLLQNCYPCRNVTEQGIPLGLTLSAQLLNGGGAWRVHGGGFAGTVQAFVPENLLKDYVAGMERVFGQDKCLQLGIRLLGATRLPVSA